MGKEGNSRDKTRSSKKLKPQRKKPVNNFLNEVKWVDYKDVQFLKRFMNDKNKIVARRSTGRVRRIFPTTRGTSVTRPARFFTCAGLSLSTPSSSVEKPSNSAR